MQNPYNRLTELYLLSVLGLLWHSLIIFMLLAALVEHP